MLITSSYEQTVKEISIVFCTVTVAFISILLTIIILTGHYILLGSFGIIPVYVLLLAVEFMKWTYAQFCFYEESVQTALIDKKLPRFASYLLKNFRFTEFVKSFIFLILSTIAYFIMTILFGAALLENQRETLMFSLLLTILTIYPLCLNYGSESIVRLINGKPPNNVLHILLHKNVIGTLLGAWFGAFAIPLDWDRPWQIWPIPCSTGALIGHAICHFIMLINIYLSTSTKLNKISRKKH